jgi:uncharacterized protein
MKARQITSVGAALQARPVASSERADILDILRGFALLGIALANYSVLSYYRFMPPDVTGALPTAGTDRWLEYFSICFIEGKFYSLFSLLFGVGFSVIMARRNSAGGERLTFFYRRLLILMLIGIVHTLVIWDGDILLFYGLVGLILPLFREVKDKTVLAIAAVLLLSPLLFDTLKVLTDGKLNIALPVWKMATAVDKKLGITEENLFSWLKNNNTFNDHLRWNQAGAIWSFFLRLDSNRIPKVLAMFLLGMCLGRINFHAHLAEHKGLLRYIQVIGFGVGVPAGIAMIFFREDAFRLPHAGGLLDTLSYALNVSLLSLGYAATFCLWALNSNIKKRLDILRPVGRMALTNYLMQSVCGVVLFAPVGMGFGGSVGPTVYFPLVLALYVVQIGYSHAWLSKFDYGPIEWIWRQLSYGRRLPLVTRRNNTEGATP